MSPTDNVSCAALNYNFCPEGIVEVKGKNFHDVTGQFNVPPWDPPIIEWIRTSPLYPCINIAQFPVVGVHCPNEDIPPEKEEGCAIVDGYGTGDAFTNEGKPHWASG